MSVCEIGYNKYTFAFSQKETFNGKAFFEKYKYAHFLTDLKNITKILCQGHELRDCWNSLKPGDQVIVEGMFLKPGDPLVIKKTGREDESDVRDHDFTFRRLSGLAAAVASTHPFFSLRILEAETLGLHWSNDDLSQKLYLAAVSGAEYFVDQFDVLPFICALRKFQLNKISAETVLRIKMIPHVDDEPMVNRLRTLLHTEELKECEKRFSGITFNISKELLTEPTPCIVVDD